jgi:3-deoxy-manno-octulosonate cytidylyltransferase (CMP-KDO synthetase)
MKVAAVIPARYASTRFPKKPLAPILGKPMILWVAELTSKAVGLENTYVATDHVEIANVVRKAGFNAVLTSSEALTGTDRIAEASQQIDADLFVNVQGDEPMLDPQSILKVIEGAVLYPGSIVNGFAPLTHDEDPNNNNIPKCVISTDQRLIYMSRLAVPGYKDIANKTLTYYKQVCIYALSKDHLFDFSRTQEKAPCEKSEDIEILRFLDMGYEVRMVKLPSSTLAVDNPEDIGLVESAMRKLNGHQK